MVREWQEDRGKLLTFVTPRVGRFEAVQKKPLYQLCVKVCRLDSLVGVKVSKWTELFGQDKSPTGSWRSLYKLPVEKRSADLQWRIIHRAIATNRHIAHLDPGHGRGCLFCGQDESLVHLFTECPRLTGLLGLVKSWCTGFGEHFSLDLFIYGPKYKVRK